MTWLILEHHRPTGTIQPMDGEIYHDRAVLLRTLAHADRGDRVAEFDLAEFFRDGMVSFRDVTEDVVRDAIAAGDINEDAEIVCGVGEAGRVAA